MIGDANSFSSLMVSWGARGSEILEFIRVGTSTNWFGLGCPAHCGAASWPAILPFYVLGLLSRIGLLFCLDFGLGICWVPLASSSSARWPSSLPFFGLFSSEGLFA